MAKASIVQVVDSGPGYTTVLASDGQTYTLKGNAAWRNNNPGNLRPGSLTKSLGAIGVSDTKSNGKFLVFPDRSTGLKAQEALQFATPRYAQKSISDAISSYAPTGDNNNPAAYAARLAAAAGVPVTAKMSDLTPSQRSAYLAAQHGVENGGPGTIRGPEGEPVPDAIRALFGGVPLPPEPINPLDAGTQFASYGAGRVPLPAPAPLLPPKTFAQMPASAMYGQDRLVPGQVTRPPTDFTTAPAGAPDLRALGMMSPQGVLSSSGGAMPGIAAAGSASLAGMPPMPIPRPAMAPPAPIQAQPPQLPAQRPSAPVAPAPIQLRLASGKSIAPGVYQQPDGHSVQVSDAGDGTAKITQIHGFGSVPGVIDPMKELADKDASGHYGTIAGRMIANMLPGQLGGNASAFVPTLGNNVKSAALGAANNLGGALSGFGGGIMGGLGGLFGQHPPALPHPFNLLGGALRQPPVPQNRPIASVPQLTRTQQAQNDLRASGMLDQFGMIR